jgi:hypothetical protein
LASSRWIYRRKSGFLERDVGGRIALVPVTGEGADLQRFFLLNASAKAVWDALAEPLTLEEVLSVLERSFEAPPGVMEEEVAELLAGLAARNVVERRDAARG